VEAKHVWLLGDGGDRGGDEDTSTFDVWPSKEAKAKIESDRTRYAEPSMFDTGDRTWIGAADVATMAKYGLRPYTRRKIENQIKSPPKLPEVQLIIPSLRGYSPDALQVSCVVIGLLEHDLLHFCLNQLLIVQDGSSSNFCSGKLRMLTSL
jgi:hypothetical protein